MTRRLRARPFALWFLGAVAAAFLVDRVALYAWGASVLSQFQSYRQSVSQTSRAARPASLADMTDPPLWMGPITSPSLPVENPLHGRVDLFLSLEPAHARPDFVFVKGRVLELLYLPPALAWTTRIFPLRPHGLQSRMYRSKDYYGYRIAADFSGDLLPVFKLYRVRHFEAEELSGDTRRPEVFP